jgi:beta-mannanase
MALVAPSTPAGARAVTVKSANPTAFGLNVWTLAELDASQSAIGSPPAVVGVFRDWAHAPNFPTALAASVASRGASLMIAWEPWDSWRDTASQPAYRLNNIALGKYDALVNRWAKQARDFRRPVLIRFAPEMNGDWRPWSTGVNGNPAGSYVRAWRHVVDRFRTVGATNVEWVWNPYVEVGESTPMAASYPGASYVDWTALDGYNWGSVRQWGWQSYDDIFASSVRRLKVLAPTKPWMMAEIGCAPGTGKPAWISDTFSRARSDGAGAIVWFEFSKETDWRIASTPGAAAALRSLLRAGGWQVGGNLAAVERLW